MNPTYETMIVTFGKPVQTVDAFFDDPRTWGVSTLKEWIDSYESTRFTPIDECRAVITSEYNMAHVRKWMERHMPIAECRTA